MTQPNPDGRNDPVAVADYRQQSREFPRREPTIPGRRAAAPGVVKRDGARRPMDGQSRSRRPTAWRYDRHEHFERRVEQCPGSLRATTGCGNLRGIAHMTCTATFTYPPAVPQPRRQSAATWKKSRNCWTSSNRWQTRVATTVPDRLDILEPLTEITA